ncbi:MAG: RT0821/Lpp0805 family surface protein [Proteobacteria bacterium]|nr:RT0821/Lpp0805 family surface protein [Pseudomonadota bacterium]MDA1059816.1 RT0821/Lpp0805 family surface protein [Pseudomonadota bacterium]
MGFLAIAALAVAGCADRDERARLGDLVIGAGETEVAAAPAAEAEAEAAARETTLILAALLATDVGQTITAADQLALERTTQTTLETVPIGTQSTWRNPQTGSHGVIAPRKTFQRASGTYCREFTQTLVSGNVIEEALGTACREPDGTWKLADN